MRFPQAYAIQNSLPTNTPIVGVAGSVVAGPAIDSGVASMLLGVVVQLTLGTASLSVTGKWQVLLSGTTWMDVVESNNPANVTLLTAAGSVNKVISAPLAVSAANRQARFVLVTAGATGAGGATDFAIIGYDYRQPTTVYGS